MFSPLVIALCAAACGVLALVLGLLAYAQKLAGKNTMSAHLQRTMERQAGRREAPFTEDAEWGVGPSAAHQRIQTTLQHWLRISGLQALGVERKHAAYWCTVALLIYLVVWLWLGVAPALTAVLVLSASACFFFWKKQEKRRKKMLEQLPGFLDNMVRLITLGTSPQAAFQIGVDSAAEPLASAVRQAVGVLSASSDLAQSMEFLEDTWRLPEFGLLAAVFRMSTKYGGRTDQVLERVAAYIRDKHAAERELHAMSAEVRLSAWVLSLLPVVVGAAIMFLNQNYFLRMWHDESGRQTMVLAMALELVGVVLLYRLAKLR